MLWRFIPAHWWRVWGPLATTSVISVALLLLGDRVQLPIVRGLRATVLYPASAVDRALRTSWDLRGENTRLKRELAEARARLDWLEEADVENTRLAGLLDFATSRPETLIAGQVVGRGQSAPRDWSHLTVRASLPPELHERELVAITPHGLVGQVIERSLGFVTVRSLASARSAVHVVARRSRVAGVVRAEGGVGSLLRMDHVPAQEDLAPGDTLVTSGQGEIYPRGVPVGHVVRVDIAGDALVKNVWVEPWVRFSRLEEVFLVPGLGAPE